MLWRTHFLAGAAIGAAYAAITHPGETVTSVICIGVGGVAGLLPDIDSPQSKLGAAIRPVSDIINLSLGHRGILHSLLGMLIILSLASLAVRIWLPTQAVFETYLPVAALGFLSHLVLDALTPGGVPFLWPKSTKYSIPLVKTGSLFERLVFLPGLVLVVILAFNG